MKKIFLLSATILFMTDLFAQDTTLVNSTVVSQPAETSAPKPKKKYNLSNRANDHFMFQTGYTGWAGKPDSIHTKGFPRSFNLYFMFDFPFKSTPKISAAIGLGFGSDNIFFKKSSSDIKGTTQTLRFNRPADTVFKKSKLSTTYLEVPVELRYTSDPEHSGKSFKFAVGVKVGTMLNAHTRNRTTASSTVTDHIVKESSKRYFNTTRAVGTLRVGYGVISVFGSYQFTNLLKDAAGPAMHPYTIGLTFSGL